MREKIRINTFESERNQGFVVHLGDIVCDIDKAWILATRRQCCTSDEIVPELAETVKFDGRTFILKESMMGEVGRPRLEVTVPYGFTPSIVKNRCKKCGQRLPE